MPTVDDLRQIIRRIENARPPRPAPEPIERVLGGDLLENDAGAILVVRREYALSHRHGGHALHGAFVPAPEALGAVLSGGAAGPLDARRLLFLDTETTGLAGGTGTYAFLVGVGYLEGERFVILQYFMRDFDDEPALLAALAPLLAGASGVVTFNGSGFDVPLLETRFILGRRRWPATLSNVDLLRPARRVWGTRLDDCRLGTLEREVLGLVREDDVAGALIPALYFDFLRSRRAAPLGRVFAHNRDDVLSLVTLLGWFSGALAGAEGVRLRGDEVAGLGRLWERVDLERALDCYREALAGGLTGPGAQWVRLRLAWWEKRGARWDAACALWDAASRHDVFDPRPWEELAKFHEHRARDLATARAIVEDALGLARAAAAPPLVLDALAHRLARLDRRFRLTTVRADARADVV